jgi:hypothetical protein
LPGYGTHGPVSVASTGRVGGLPFCIIAHLVPVDQAENANKVMLLRRWAPRSPHEPRPPSDTLFPSACDTKTPNCAHFLAHACDGLRCASFSTTSLPFRTRRFTRVFPRSCTTCRAAAPAFDELGEPPMPDVRRLRRYTRPSSGACSACAGLIHDTTSCGSVAAPYLPAHPNTTPSHAHSSSAKLSSDTRRPSMLRANMNDGVVGCPRRRTLRAPAKPPRA